MSRCTLVWGHALASSVAHEDEMGAFDWDSVRSVARVERYDARGHGTSEAPYEERAFRWSALVDDMLYAAPMGPFVAGGTGMGAVTALYAALRARRRVQGLVLTLLPAAWEAREPWAQSLRHAARMVETKGLSAYLMSLRDRPQAPILSHEGPRAADLAFRQLRQMDQEALPAILRGAAESDLPSRQEIRNLCVPTLILAREGDPGHPVATAQALAELMVMSEIHVAEDMADVRAWPALVADFMAGIHCFEPEEQAPSI